MVDVAIIGDGIIGLSTALELGRAGATVHLFGADFKGNASEAAAGLLSPTAGDLPADVRPFFDTSLHLYPGFVARLVEYDSDLAIVHGLIELSERFDENRALERGSRRLDSEELSGLEPVVSRQRSAILHERNGSIDNVRLVAALRQAVAASPGITHDRATVSSVDFSDHDPIIVTNTGDRFGAGTVVLAAGAWASAIGGLPRAIPVTPLKGQMLAVASTAIRHPIMADDVYLVPRATETVIGATVERAGFDLSVIPDAVEALRRAAIGVCPGFTNAQVIRAWAGVRPATPDLLPIIAQDPDESRLIYACGHSKNGILLAPATAVAVAALAQGKVPSVDVGPFSISRFE